MSDLREFQDALLVRNVVARANKHAGGATEFLQGNVKALSELSHGMSAEAKKDGISQFGMRDVREALTDWFKGAPEPKDPKGTAARRFLESDKGKRILKKLTEGVAKALKDEGQKPVGFKDVGKALIDFLS